MSFHPPTIKELARLLRRHPAFCRKAGFFVYDTDEVAVQTPSNPRLKITDGIDLWARIMEATRVHSDDKGYSNFLSKMLARSEARICAESRGGDA